MRVLEYYHVLKELQRTLKPSMQLTEEEFRCLRMAIDHNVELYEGYSKEQA